MPFFKIRHLLICALIAWVPLVVFLYSVHAPNTPRPTSPDACVCPTALPCRQTSSETSNKKTMLPVRENPRRAATVATNGDGDDPSWGPHKLAVIVPFRDRFEELLEFAPHMHAFLNRQRVRHQIWVINQVDEHRFNRASLLNIGFLLSRVECDYIAMHDVDLLPLNDNLSYAYPAEGPFHVSGPEIHPLYHYKTFVGGILLLSNKQFEKVRGLSNLFWGWGREDDELYLRMREAGMTVSRRGAHIGNSSVYRPTGITTGYHSFKHNHNNDKRKRDQKRYYNQAKVSRMRDRTGGFHDVRYSVDKRYKVTVNGAPVNVVAVKLECDYDKTPFCDAPG